jgi:hypothetical protein
MAEDVLVSKLCIGHSRHLMVPTAVRVEPLCQHRERSFMIISILFRNFVISFLCNWNIRIFQLMLENIFFIFLQLKVFVKIVCYFEDKRFDIMAIHY